MLVYLDSVTSKKNHPNENLARELMELFSLGEGNFTERDVQQVARALTGYGLDAERAFRFDPRQHDFGKKSILGTEGRYNADGVVDVLLAQPACARWVARNLLLEFEGLEPGEERLAEYARALKDEKYELRPFLRRLFLDPRFYRKEIVGAKVQGPVEYLVGLCRRSGLRIRGQLLVGGATLLGQELFEPPSVEGWHEGHAWITTSTLMNRGNLAGVLFGTLTVEDLMVDPVLRLGDAESDLAMAEDVPMMELEPPVMEGEPLDEEEQMSMTMMSEEESPEVARERSAASRNVALRSMLRILETTNYTPRVNLSARIDRGRIRTEREIVRYFCDSLLAIEAPEETQELLLQFLRTERAELERTQGDWRADRVQFERLLRRLAHLIYSLPEAQLG